MEKVSLLWIATMSLQLVGFLFSLIGYGGNYIVEAIEFDIHGGLWQTCHKDNCGKTSYWISKKKRSEVWLEASKGMMTISILCQFLTILLTAIALFRTMTILVGWVTSVVAAFSVFTGLIGVCVAAGEGKNFLEDHVKNVPFKLGWSFILFIIGQCAYLLAAVWHYFDSRNKSIRHNSETDTI